MLISVNKLYWLWTTRLATMNTTAVDSNNTMALSRARLILVSETTILPLQ